METQEDIKTAQQVKKNITRFEAPAVLRQKIRHDMGLHRGSPPVAPTTPWHKWVQFLTGQWSSLSAGVATGALATFIGMHFYISPLQDTLPEEIASSHVRSLMANHLSDVASTEKHTVKPWFMGKLDYAPPVNDFAAQGFALQGGRVDYLDQRAVAALVYQNKQHVINAFVWPTAQANSNPRVRSHKGFNMVQWQGDGMTFWLVSDISTDELLEFAKIMRLMSADGMPKPG